MNSDEVIKWETRYDESKYPYGLYRELVLEGKEHPRKFELMGAWKTGCLIVVDPQESQYQDKNGINYGFTGRWKDSTPVGFKTWNYVTKNQQILKEQVPIIFPVSEPIIMQHLKSFKGFGFVMAVFVLHCWYPETYPLFDQHVYRAYKFLETDGRENPKNIDDSWQAYTEYRSYFMGRWKGLKIEFWRLDKALWAFGKSLKPNQSTPISLKTERTHNYIKIKKPSGTNDDLWASSNTLGAKQKRFKWWLTDTNDLIISRRYKSGQYSQKTISKQELNEINDYMSNNDWVDLANNVEKLQQGTEKKGLGWFLYNKLNKTTEESQLSSHLAAIFVDAGIWDFNQKQKGMKFKLKPGNWAEMLTHHKNSLKAFAH